MGRSVKGRAERRAGPERGQQEAVTTRERAAEPFGIQQIPLPTPPQEDQGPDPPEREPRKRTDVVQLALHALGLKVGGVIGLPTVPALGGARRSPPVLAGGGRGIGDAQEVVELLLGETLDRPGLGLDDHTLWSGGKCRGWGRNEA